jgi:hypothetical protein
MSEKFLNDVQKVYDYINNQKSETNKLYEYLEKKQIEKLGVIDDFAKALGIETLSDDMRLALITRLVNLRDDSLVQVLKKLDYNEKEVIELQEKSYFFAKDHWLDIHKKTVLIYIKKPWSLLKATTSLAPFTVQYSKGAMKRGSHLAIGSQNGHHISLTA